MSEVVQVERNGGVATIRMNRPERMNAYNPEMGKALLSAVSEASADPSVRCMVLTGTGKAFSAGGDVESFAAFQDEGPGKFLGLAIGLHALIATLRRAPKPVIAAVNGVAAGAGFSMALACDVAVAASSARFTLGYQNIGLSPDGGMTFFLARALGTQRAMEMTLFSKVLSAAQAAEWGLVQEIFPDAEFAAGVDALAERLAAGPTLAYAQGEGAVQPRAVPTAGDAARGGAAEHRPVRGEPGFPRGDPGVPGTSARRASRAGRARAA